MYSDNVSAEEKLGLEQGMSAAEHFLGAVSPCIAVVLEKQGTDQNYDGVREAF